MDTKTKLLRRSGLLATLVVLVAAGVLGYPHIARFAGQFFAPGSLRTLNGETVESVEAYLADHPAGPGRLAYVLYWRSDCSACAKQLPGFFALDTIGGDLSLVAVNVGESERAVRAHLREMDLPTSASHPVLIGARSLPGDLTAIPTILMYVRTENEWAAIGHSEGLRTAEDLQALAYQMLIGALGGMSFWDGNLTAGIMSEWEGHHVFVLDYSAEYEPTPQEIVEVYELLFRAADVEPEHGVYIHVIVTHETYGSYVAFTISATAEQARAFLEATSTDETEARARLNMLVGVDSDTYYFYTSLVPKWDGTEKFAWIYAYLTANLAEHPWAVELRDHAKELAEAE